MAISQRARNAFFLTTIIHTLCVLFAADYSSRFRDTFDAAETESLFSTWQLSKVVAHDREGRE